MNLIARPILPFEILIIIIISGITTICAAFYVYPNTCSNEQCFKRGLEINESIYDTVKPCDNFYKYSCGGWMSKVEKPASEIVWNHWHSVAHTINKRIRNIVERKFFNMKSINKARSMYKTCLNGDRDYVDELILLIDALGGWPLIVGDDWWTRAKNYDWLMGIAEISKLFRIHPLLKFHVNLNFQNTTLYILHVDPGDLVLPKYILQHPAERIDELIKYKEWILNSIKVIYPDRDLPQLNDRVDDIIAFEIRLAQLLSDTGDNRKEIKTIGELPQKSNSNWLQIIKLILSDIDFNPAFNNINEDTELSVSITYLDALIALLEKTDSKIIANYLIWHVIKDLARDTNSQLRYLNFQINNAILGIDQDYPLNYECANRIGEYFNAALIYGYSRLYFENYETVNKEVEYMFDEIKLEFVKTLKRNKWLGVETKKRAIAKIASIEILIGFPKRWNDENVVENFYNDVTISDNHFLNVLHLRGFLAKRNLEKISSRAVQQWPDNLFDVNGYYNPIQNTIIISMGLLEKPFFVAGSPFTVLNYGALGSLIGHELSHAFDINTETTREYPWTNADWEKYKSKLNCFEDQYNSYNGVNGQITIGENIADNVGLELSFRAYYYRQYDDRKRKIHKQSILPFVEKYANEKLFFIAYAQMWCEIVETGNADDLLQEDEHSPAEFRVRGVVRNSDYFQKIFKCKNKKDDKKCYLW